LLVSIQSLGKLIDNGGDFHSFEQNSLLSLDNDVFGPFDESG